MNTSTRDTLISRLVLLLSAAVVLIVVVMPVHAFVSTWLGTAIGPLLLWKSWKEILLVAIVPLVIGLLALRPDIWRVIWGRAVNKLIALYALLHVLLAFSSTATNEAVVAGLMMNLRFLAIFVIVQVIVEARPSYLERLKRLAPRWLLWTAVGLGVLAILQVFVLPKDFLVSFGYDKDTTIAPYILVDENPDAVRAFATMRGPNTLGAFLLLPLAIACCMVWRKRRDSVAWAALALGLIGVYLTGSRSAWLGAVVAIVMVLALLVPRERFVRGVKIGAVPALLVLAVIAWAAVNVPAVRLAIFHSSPGDASLTEGSSDKHWEATINGINDVVRHPWGSGPGSAGPASFYNSTSMLSENYYVQVAQEVGILGLGLFIAICALVIRSIVRRPLSTLRIGLLASFAAISFINLLLHGWADDPTSLAWWAFAGLAMGPED